MAKMQIAPKDRPKVLRECRRLLATLQLTPERSALIWAFVKGYLQLSSAEMKLYERDVANQTLEEQVENMQLMSTIERKGMHEGQERMLTLMIERRLGTVAPEIIVRLDDLISKQLEQLGVEFLDFTSVAELEAWFARH